MAFITIVALIAFALSIVSGVFSVIGLAATFPSIATSAIALGTVLKAGELAAASFVYRYREIASKWLTIPMSFFVVILMAISISGNFGYLSKGYQTDSMQMKQIVVQVENLQAERDRKIHRKEEIDVQIAQLPSEYAGARIRLAKQFQDEQKTVTDRINQLDSQITELKTKEIEANAHIGPIAYIASALGISTDDSVKWLILLIVSVFDPLTMALTISVSVMLMHRQKLKEQVKSNVVDKFPTPPPRTRKKRVEQEPEQAVSAPSESEPEIESSGDLFAMTDEEEPEPPKQEVIGETTAKYIEKVLGTTPTSGTVYHEAGHEPHLQATVSDPHHTK